MKTVLLVDDEDDIREVAQMSLEMTAGWKIESANNGAAGIKKALEVSPDAILLDVMMPELTGLEVCREIRKTLSTPIIILTAKGEEIDRVLGLELGADDYIVKPFSPREVIARIKAVLRRINEPSDTQSVLRFDGLEINLANYIVKVNGESIPCTPKEVEILFLLASHSGQVMGRDQILSLVWGYDYTGDPRTVDTHIKRIRQKVFLEGARWSISTVYSVGYKFEVV